MDTQLAIWILAAGTFVLNVATVGLLAALVHRTSRARALALVARYALRGMFVLSALAILGTLYMQFVGALVPCVLCWWQRIFMYPIAIITFIAMFKGRKVSEVADYILALSLIGAAFAFYQHLLQMLPSGTLIPCDPSNDCAIRSIFEFGYITIPWMALSAFVFLALVALVVRTDRN